MKNYFKTKEMKIKYILILLLLLPFYSLIAQEIVYKPINPSFLGGNPFNASWLLSNAESQNKFKEDSDGFEEKSELERFTESLNRQLLNELSRDLFQQEFGDQGLTIGTYTFGSLVVEITPTTGGLSIDIFDTQTGEQTQIIIPN
jgi:curli production assembly/transport component CsgF